MLQNEALVAKIGFDTAENEPSKVCRYQPSTPPTVINSALMTCSEHNAERRVAAGGKSSIAAGLSAYISAR